MRTIDADAILKRAEESFKNAGLHGEDYRKIKKWLRIAPTIDAVEVVRCKGCKHKRLYDEGDTKYYYCALEDRPNRNWSVDDMDYCSWGDESEVKA